MKKASDGKWKGTLLTEAPANEASPTAAELNAGIEISCHILDSDKSWTNTDSATFDEKPPCVKGQVQALGASNYDLGFTFLREYLEAGGPDVAGEDAGYQAVKTKQSEVWIYARETDKDSPELWEAGDEVYLGGKVHSDVPARVNNEGNIKRRVKFLPQSMHENITVA
jgi:hypothetical protein